MLDINLLRRDLDGVVARSSVARPAALPRRAALPAPGGRAQAIQTRTEQLQARRNA
jgi:hypothetical protein